MLAISNMLLLLFPIISNELFTCNIFSLAKVLYEFGGTKENAEAMIIYGLLAFTAAFELVFIIMSFCMLRASGTMGIIASLITAISMLMLKSAFNPDYITVILYLVCIIPFITLILSVIVLIVRKKAK